MSASPTIPAAPAIYGLLAEFDGPEALLAAAERVHEAGYHRFDVFSPFPIHGMDRAMGLGRSKLGWFTAIGATVGALSALGLQWFCNAVDYPTITGGKPLFSWQAFMPIIFELSVLVAAIATVVGMFVINGLPQWYHPTLKLERFAGASNNQFFLAIEAADRVYDSAGTRRFLEEIGGRHISELEE